MKISKEDDENILTVYQPDENEQEVLGEVSDKIIDLMDEHKLNTDQRIHLITCLFKVMKEMNGITRIKHIGASEVNDEQD